MIIKYVEAKKETTTHDMWKRSFDQMRIELIQIMRLYNIQKTKLEYAIKQKQLYQARAKNLKADLSKAWTELSNAYNVQGADKPQVSDGIIGRLKKLMTTKRLEDGDGD